MNKIARKLIQSAASQARLQAYKAQDCAAKQALIVDGLARLPRENELMAIVLASVAQTKRKVAERATKRAEGYIAAKEEIDNLLGKL